MVVLTLGLLSVNKINASAVDITAFDGTIINDENRSEYMCKNPYGEVIFPNNLEYGEKQISLFCEYKNEEKAMEKYILENQEILSYIENEYNIEPLNLNNWKKYKEYITNITHKKDIDENLLNQAQNSDLFFNIYEDKYTNIMIANIVNSLKKQGLNSLDSLLINELNEITPYYSEKIATPFDIEPYVSPDLNVSKATAYAKKWAWSNNTNEYKDLGDYDCTNFVSQILEAGGIKQHQTLSEKTGWWHVKVGGLHKHSLSWTSASSFGNHWGARLRTSNIVDWADSLYEGDIVALDTGATGSWNHLGYVTERGTPNTASAISGHSRVIFRDIKIAQHSENYERWISEEDNRWEEAFTAKVYGKLRG